MHIIKLENLSISCKDNVLVDNVCIELNSQKVTALVGKSGSGKTLTTMALLGFLPTNLKQNGAKFFLDGKELDSNFSRIKIFSNIMQNPKTAFNPIMKIKSHAVETLKATANFNKDYKDLILQTLKDVGLDSKVYDMYPFEMSGGMLQRAMIALALLAKPKFIIADEPTTDLDLLVQSKILELLNSIIKSKNIGMLIVTHDFGVVAKISDEVLVMNGGKIIEKNYTKEIFNSPKNEYTKELLSAHNKLCEVLK